MGVTYWKFDRKFIVELRNFFPFFDLPQNGGLIKLERESLKTFDTNISNF